MNPGRGISKSWLIELATAALAVALVLTAPISLAASEATLPMAETAKATATAVATPATPSLTSDSAPAPAPTNGAEPAINFFSDKPIPETMIVHTPPPKPLWMTWGGPLGVLLIFWGLLKLTKKLIPFQESKFNFNLRDLPVAAQRGIGMSVIMFGIAFLFGAFEVHYQVTLNGSAEAYFAQMSVGKLIALTHVHLFGFTTAYFIIGIPFSMHFYRLRIYQWIFPMGLTASICDLMAWWGLKFVSPNFEYVTWFCGAVFSICYMWMLVGLVRVIFFPNIRGLSDFFNEDHQLDWHDKS